MQLYFCGDNNYYNYYCAKKDEMELNKESEDVSVCSGDEDFPVVDLTGTSKKVERENKREHDEPEESTAVKSNTGGEFSGTWNTSTYRLVNFFNLDEQL